MSCIMISSDSDSESESESESCIFKFEYYVVAAYLALAVQQRCVSLARYY